MYNVVNENSETNKQTNSCFYHKQNFLKCKQNLSNCKCFVPSLIFYMILILVSIRLLNIITNRCNKYKPIKDICIYIYIIDLQLFSHQCFVVVFLFANEWTLFHCLWKIYIYICKGKFSHASHTSLLNPKIQGNFFSFFFFLSL